MTRDIYIATIIDSYNYGTVLQAVATSDILSSYGNPLFVDYCRTDWTWFGWIKDYLGNRDHNIVVNAARLVVNLPTRIQTKPLFRRFVTTHLPLVDAKPFIDGGAFDEGAVYCVGSDQTWNAVLNKGIDPVYTLRNVPESSTKVSFSASFGRPDIPLEEQDAMRPLLQQFRAISVRESSGVGILDGMGIHGAVALKDPVLLCNPQLWNRLCSEIPKTEEAYVLVYMLNRNDRAMIYAKRLAVQLGIKVRVLVHNSKMPAPEGAEGIVHPTPEGWLAAFRDASAVITDSFHGTCFSILFEKPMTVFNPPRFSVRLADVLNDFGLADRRVSDDARHEDITVGARSVDWTSTRIRLARFRAEARTFLEDCMGHNAIDAVANQ